MREKTLSKVHSHVTDFLHSLVWLFFCLANPTAASSAAVTLGGSKSMAVWGGSEPVQPLCWFGCSGTSMSWGKITWQENSPSWEIGCLVFCWCNKLSLSQRRSDRHPNVNDGREWTAVRGDKGAEILPLPALGPLQTWHSQDTNLRQ